MPFGKFWSPRKYFSHFISWNQFDNWKIFAYLEKSKLGVSSAPRPSTARLHVNPARGHPDSTWPKAHPGCQNPQPARRAPVSSDHATPGKSSPNRADHSRPVPTAATCSTPCSGSPLPTCVAPRPPLGYPHRDSAKRPGRYACRFFPRTAKQSAVILPKVGPTNDAASGW
jgi:hypothetical protein